ncbi:MAG: glycosyltransferase family 2 protein [Lentimicrobium sp.]
MCPKVYAAIPVLDELENLPVLLADLLRQVEKDWEAVFCINQPGEWWHDEQKKEVCQRNQKSIDYLASLNLPQIHIIDKSSPGRGWTGKNHGVGWARKTAMDDLSAMAGPDDLMVSMDADTRYSPGFFGSIIAAAEKYPNAAGLSVPYYHPLTGDETTDRCVLRYEIYMRNYALNMLLINSPYAFSAIGSGMACKASVYRRMGGITPKMSGEDFYFMQKLRKSGNIVVDIEDTIYPASRFSDRVYFGTGPALIKGRTGDWSSYPIYSNQAFQLIRQTYDLFGKLFEENSETPMDTFLIKVTQGKPIWEPLRSNASGRESFIRACTQRVDALRILQFLKETNHTFPEGNERRLHDFLTNHFETNAEVKEILLRLDFGQSTIPELDSIRNFMTGEELLLQKKKGIV